MTVSMRRAFRCPEAGLLDFLLVISAKLCDDHALAPWAALNVFVRPLASERLQDEAARPCTLPALFSRGMPDSC